MFLDLMAQVALYTEHHAVVVTLQDAEVAELASAANYYDGSYPRITNGFTPATVADEGQILREVCEDVLAARERDYDAAQDALWADTLLEWH